MHAIYYSVSKIGNSIFTIPGMYFYNMKYNLKYITFLYFVIKLTKHLKHIKLTKHLKHYLKYYIITSYY